MLTELRVRNLGVIDELALVLDSGMTAVSGETGAGKTLMVSAIELLIGGRADMGLIRSGADYAEVEGRFVTGDEDSAEVVVRRVIPRRSRSRAYINGRLATAAALAEFGRTRIELHGQHAHQSLLRPATQRAALDRFGDIDTSAMTTLTQELRRIEKARAQLGGDVRARAREIDLLRYQQSEIDAAALDDPDEQEHLEAAISVLADAESHRDAARNAVALLDADGPVTEGLDRAWFALSERSPFADLADRLADTTAEITDVAAEIRTRAESIEDDPMMLAEMLERRQILAELCRKYGSSLTEVMDFADTVAQRLAELENHDAQLAELDRRRDAAAEALEASRAQVLDERVKSAPRLAAEVVPHLRDLAMASARMEVAVAGSAGEQVTFRLAANPGHGLRPLARAASGGELARVMLALRLVLISGPPTLVFDEVDAGIGGAAAHAVGCSLAALADAHQVLVVTHLAQVAAHADHHVMVHKSATNEDSTTSSSMRTLNRDQRVIEMSRMLSGSPNSASAQQHARELLASASSR